MKGKEVLRFGAKNLKKETQGECKEQYNMKKRQEIELNIMKCIETLLCIISISIISVATYSHTGVQLQQSRCDVGREGHVITDSPLTGSHTQICFS